MRKPSPFKIDVDTLIPLSAEQVGLRNLDSISGHNAVAIGKFLNTLSTLFPEGEQFFVDAVRHYRTTLRASGKLVAGSSLDKDIGTFIGHEAHHTNVHHDLNKALYKGKYVNPTDILRYCLKGINRRAPLLALHATSVLEHYTATMARFILDHEDIRSLLGTSELALWEYHAIDEWDHRCVSHDVLVIADKHRGYMLIPVSIVFILAVLILYRMNGGRYNSFLIRKLIGLVPEILRYLKNDYTP